MTMNNEEYRLSGHSMLRSSSVAFVRFGCIAICFFTGLAVTCVYRPVSWLPWLGPQLAALPAKLVGPATVWLGSHVFHLHGLAATPHPSISRDEALDWVQSALLAFISVVLAALCIILLPSNRYDRRAYTWLRFGLRLALVFIMSRYAFTKIFPLQMNPPSLAVLNEPVGQTSPMTLFWTMMAIHPKYEVLTGFVELLVASLFLFRRTTTLAALLNVFVMGNVVCYNLFFDVPVKQGALLILLATLVVLAPDLIPLANTFLLNKPRPFFDDRLGWHGHHRAALVSNTLGAVFLACVLFFYLPNSYRGLHAQQLATEHPSSLTGGWRFLSDTVQTKQGPKQISLPTGTGEPMTELYFEPDGLAMVRARDGRLWRSLVTVDENKHTFSLSSYLFQDSAFAGQYAFSQADSQHLKLVPFPLGDGIHGVILMERIPLATSYPLLDRGFHWVQESAFER